MKNCPCPFTAQTKNSQASIGTSNDVMCSKGYLERVPSSTVEAKLQQYKPDCGTAVASGDHFA